SRSQTTHLIDCFSFFFAAWTAAAWLSVSITSKLLQLEEGDGDLLDLGAPLDALHDAGVPQVAADGIILAAAVGAVDLDGVVGRPGGHGGGEVLGQHDLAGSSRIAGVAQPPGAQAEEAGGTDVGDHLGEQPPDELVVA